MTEQNKNPAGPRSGAAIHRLDLQAEADRLLSELPGHHRRSNNLVRESGVSMVMMAMVAGDKVQEHSAPGVVTVQALRGRVTLSADGQQIELMPGQVTVFPPGLRHDLSAEEESVVLLTVSGQA